MGYKITLSTNGSLLNDDHLALLKENKPIAVFVTIYGSSNSSYHHFCRTDIPSKAILNNIAKLKQRGVDTRIKVIANKIIKDEIAVIRQFSKYHEMPFNIYGKINCYIDGNSYPKSLQLSPKELLSVLTNEEIEALRESYTSPFAKWEKGIKQCSAGVTNAIIDPYGYMILCNELDKRRYSILEHGFTNCWRLVGNLRKLLIEVKTYCSTCDYKEECGLCAPLFLNEYGNLNTTPMASCKYSEEMRHLLKDWGK